MGTSEAKAEEVADEADAVVVERAAASFATSSGVSWFVSGSEEASVARGEGAASTAASGPGAGVPGVLSAGVVCVDAKAGPPRFRLFWGGRGIVKPCGERAALARKTTSRQRPQSSASSCAKAVFVNF